MRDHLPMGKSRSNPGKSEGCSPQSPYRMRSALLAGDVSLGDLDAYLAWREMWRNLDIFPSRSEVRD